MSDFTPDSAHLASLLRRRKDRAYQRRSRGDQTSPADESENAAIIAAWEAGEITEGQASRALGVDRVTAREAKLRLIALGKALTYELI